MTLMSQEANKNGMMMGSGLQPPLVRRTSNTYKKKVETVD